MAEVVIDGVLLETLGAVSPPKWSTRWGTGPCGPDLASCTLAVEPGVDTSVLRTGRTFEVWDMGVLRFGGVTSEPQRGFPWTLNARSWARRAGDFDAVSSLGSPTMNPREAVTQAIARGLPWTNPDVFDNSSIGDVPPVPLRLDALLDQWAVTVSKRWGTDAYGVAFADADPTTPNVYLDASDLDIGVADDGLFTRVRAVYVSSVDGGGDPDGWDSEVADDTAAQDLYGVIEYVMDLTGLGLLSGGTAASYAAAQLALLSIPQWLNRVATNSDRLRTEGDHAVYLPSVQYGQMVHMYNVPRSLGGIQSRLGLNVVLGETDFDAASPKEISLAPVTLAVRSIADQAAQSARVAQSVNMWANTPVATF